MSEEFDLDDVERGLHELFKYAFVTKCHLDEASITPDEMKTLEELDSLEILENFKDIVVDLLQYKKECKSSDTGELTQRNEQYENMIQKLEGEVRNHIRIEHQLKLHIETSESKQDELVRDCEIAQEKAKSLEEKCRNLEIELKKTKDEIDAKSKEIERFKLKNKESPNIKAVTSVGALKKRVEQKTQELNKVQQMITTERTRPRSIRKSMGDVEFGKSYSNIKRKQTTRLTENRPKSSAKKSSSTLRSHLRNNQENKPTSKRK